MKKTADHDNSFLNRLLLFLIFLLLFYNQPFAQQSSTGGAINTDMKILEERFTAELLEQKIYEEEIEQLISTIQGDGTWPGINYKDTSRTAFEHSQHLSNMIDLGRAYKKKSSPYYRNSEVKQVLNAAFNLWLERDFICENWWWNQIGTPDRIGSLLLIMDEEITEEQKMKVAPIIGRANLDAWGARPGGDLIKIAGIMGKYGIFKEDTDILDEALEAIVGEIGFAVERGDTSDLRGLQTDLSFHHRHDRVTSTLSYGLGYASAFADWSAKVAGTTFHFPEEKLELLVDFYIDGICKTMVHGKYPDPGAKNRSITRKGTLSPKGTALAEKLLQATSYRQEELKEIVAIRKGKQKPELMSNTFFRHSEYLSHQRPDYFTSVRMYSSRNHNMEVPYNSEGLKNYHLADGSNFISRTGKEYKGIFPVWDWQKIPGTTVIQKPALPKGDEIQKKGLTEFVGAVSDGRYGAAAFNFESPHDPLTAHKSWFFFDDEFVSLGAGITSDSEYPVATTLNQSLLSGRVVSGTPGGQTVHSRGSHHLEEARWVHHDETAYIFLDPADINLENRERSGYWQEINNQSWARGLEEVHKDVFTLWLNHGITQEQAGYGYIVVPGVDLSGLKEYRATSPIKILANTSNVQAVKNRKLNISQIIFYESAEVTIAEGVTVFADKPGMVMLKTSGQTIEEITISDPIRKQSSLGLQITSRIEGHGQQWEAIWNEEEGYSSVEFELPVGESAGQSIIITLPN